MQTMSPFHDKGLIFQIHTVLVLQTLPCETFESSSSTLLAIDKSIAFAPFTRPAQNLPVSTLSMRSTEASLTLEI